MADRKERMVGIAARAAARLARRVQEQADRYGLDEEKK